MAGATQAFLVRLYPHPQLVMGVFPFIGKLNSGWQNFFPWRWAALPAAFLPWPLLSSVQLQLQKQSCHPPVLLPQKKMLVWACREDQGEDLDVLDHVWPHFAEVVSPKAVSNELCCLRLVFGDRIFSFLSLSSFLCSWSPIIETLIKHQVLPLWKCERISQLIWGQ